VSFLKEGVLRVVGHFVNKKEPVTSEAGRVEML
jgi:hypothetical protein